MNYTKPIDATVDQVEKAKQLAIKLTNSEFGTQKEILNLFYSRKLTEVESGIRKLNEVSDTCWLLAAILLHSIVYDQNLYTQSKLEWSEYISDSRKRLGLDQRDITEQLAAARFFIQHFDELNKAKWKPLGNCRKLARAELALRLSGNLEETVQHLVNDSWRDFKDWYSAYKLPKALPFDDKRPDIQLSRKGVLIDGKPLFTIGKGISNEERNRFYEYAARIYEAIKHGNEPAIIEVYDKKEEKRLQQLLAKDRKSR